MHQLDELNETQFKNLHATLGADYAKLSPREIDERIRLATESASSLFYIDMHGPMTNRFFKSSNLHGLSIPDIAGEKKYSISVDGIGEVRVGEYQLLPFDVIVATPLVPVRDLVQGYRRVFFGLWVMTLVLSVAIGFALSEAILRPVRTIQSTANRIRSDNLNERIPVAAVQDEFSQLARFLNQMFDRLEISFAEIRRFAAEASHELKTPLSLMRLHAERLLADDSLGHRKQGLGPGAARGDRPRQPDHRRAAVPFARRCRSGAGRAEGAAAATRSWPRSRRTRPALAEHGGKHFAWSHQGDGLVSIDEKRIRQALLNLLVNALSVSPPDAVVNLDSTLVDGVWHVSVVDEGPGLTPEQCERVFERFVRFGTGEDDPRGSGLGLPITRSIVTMHKGRIWATSRDVGRGLRVAIEIPARVPAPA